MLEGKVIVVTGGATGIGRGICDALAAKGGRIAVVQREFPKAKHAAEEIPGALGFAADIRDRLQVEEMTRQVVRAFGHIDGLVNNASATGEAALGAFATMPPEQVDSIVDTNLKGTLWCSQAVARLLIERQSPGCIVHIASVGAFAGQELAAVYCATKAAQVSLAQSMALELARHNIRVNAVAPGDILTSTSGHIVERTRQKGATGHYHRRTPLGHRGTPGDIGNAVAFLFSAEASFITGTTLTVDGGISILLKGRMPFMETNAGAGA